MINITISAIEPVGGIKIFFLGGNFVIKFITRLLLAATTAVVYSQIVLIKQQQVQQNDKNYVTFQLRTFQSSDRILP